MASALVARSK